MARKVEVQIVGDASSLERAFGRAARSGDKLEHGLRRIGKASAVAIGVGTGVGLVGLGLATHAAVKEFEQAQAATAQTEAVIKSTGGAANVTTKQVEALSNSLLKKTGIDDEVIQAGENMLLTFRNVRNEAGKQNDIFTQATKIGLDMSTAMKGAGFEGGSLQTTMIRLGKALNDPVTGMTALRRVGVTFTEDQKKTIKRLEETGHHLEAQKLILKELRAEFGGSAEAYGKTLPGQLMIFKENLRNVGAYIVGKFIPLFTKGMGVVTQFGDFIGRVAHAPNLKIALDITGTSVKDFAVKVKKALGDALFGSSETISAGSTGFLTVFHDGLLQQIQRQDWSAIGKSIGAAIGASIVFSATALDKMLSGMLAWVNSHAQQIAEVGATLAVRIALTLTDPGFWAHHMGLLVGVVAIAFGGALGKFGGTIGRVVVARLGPVFERALGEVALLGMRGVARLPSLIGDAIAAILPIVSRSIGAIVREVAQAPGLLAKAFRIGVLVTITRLAIDGIKSAWNAFTDWITLKALLAVRKIVEPFSHLPSFLGGWAQRTKDSVNRQIDSIHAEEFARKMERTAARVAATAPLIAQTAQVAATLARNLKSVPSDTTVRFIVKTLNFAAGDVGVGGRPRGQAAGGRIPGARVAADSVPAMLSPGEFVVTGGGEKILESMTFPGVLNWLQGKQPRHFADGGRAGSVTKNIEFDRLYQQPLVGGGSTHGLVPQVLRALAFARGHGWHGAVSSGFRTFAQQSVLYQRYLAGGPLAARPGTSSHERGQAVDVTDPGGFGATMSIAPAGSRLYNFLGARDPVHYSVSGYATGGRIPGGVIGQIPYIGRTITSGTNFPKKKVTTPNAPPPSPLPGLRRRIAALRREEARVKAQVARLQKQLRGMPSKTKAQKAARARVKKQLDAAVAHLNRIQAELRSLGQRVQEAVSHDYSALPAGIEYELAAAALTETTADDVRALTHAEVYLQNQLRRPGLTVPQKTQILQALAGVQGQMRDLTGQTAAGGGADTGAGAGTGPDNTADIQAQLDQANARAAASAESARLANAFVATGVFATNTPGGASGGQPTVIFNNLIPDADQIVKATAAIAQGAGLQDYRVTSVEKTGY